MTDWAPENLQSAVEIPEGSKGESTLAGHVAQKRGRNRRKRKGKGSSPNLFCPVAFRQDSRITWRCRSAVREDSKHSRESVNGSGGTESEREIVWIPRRRSELTLRQDFAEQVLEETDLRKTNLSKAAKSPEAVLTKKQISKFLKKHRKELRIQAAKRKIKKTVTSTVTSDVTGVLLNGIWLPNFSVSSSHGPKQTTRRRTSASEYVEERDDQSWSVEEGEDKTVDIAESSVCINGTTPATLILPSGTHQIAAPGVVPCVAWPPTSWCPWICNVPGHCHFPEQKSVETPNPTGEVFIAPSAVNAAAQRAPQQYITKDFDLADIPRNPTYGHQAAAVYYSENWGTSGHENSLNPKQQECGGSTESEPFTVSCMTAGSKSDDQWQSLSAILPYISDRAEYIEVTEKEEVEEIHVVDEEFTGDMFSGCETADFILQECDIAAPVSSWSSFHYGEIPSNEQSEDRLEQGSRIQEPRNPTSCGYNPADENLSLSQSSDQQANTYWIPEHEQVSIGGLSVTAKGSVSNLNSRNNWNRMDDSGEMRLGYSSPSLRYSDEPRTVPELLQNKAIIRTNALEILCILEDDEDNAIDALIAVCKYAKWNPPQFKIAVCTRDDGRSPLYRCQISARGESYGPYEAEKNQTLAKIKAAQECIKELKTGLLQYLHKIK